MPSSLCSCFESLEKFKKLDETSMGKELPSIVSYLESFPDDLEPKDSYCHVKKFLFEHAKAPSYNCYRSAVEKLLLWSLVERKRPVSSLKEQDIYEFIEFCGSPPGSWVTQKHERRYRLSKNKRDIMFNYSWRPFCFSKHASSEDCNASTSDRYFSSRAVMTGLLSIINSFFEYLVQIDAVPVNPVYRIHRDRVFTSHAPDSNRCRFFTSEEWHEIVQVAENIADHNPDHERTLLLIATIYYLFISPKEIDILGGSLMISSLSLRSDGYYDVKIAHSPELLRDFNIPVHPDFVDIYVLRYRNYLGRHQVSNERDHTFLLGKNRGKGSVTSRYANSLFDIVCEEIINTKELAGETVKDDSCWRQASILWLRDSALSAYSRINSFDNMRRAVKSSKLDDLYERFYSWQQPQRGRVPSSCSIRPVGKRTAI
jgi:hypothetical protein